MAIALLFTLIGIAPAAPASGEVGGVPFRAADTFERRNDAKRLSLGHETACVILESGDIGNG